MRRRTVVAMILLGAGLSTMARASLPDGFNHPDLNWNELKTPHFRVIYHDGLENTAEMVATIAEGNYERVCQSIGAYPTSATPIIIADYTTRTQEFAAQLKHSIWLVGNTINDARIDKASWFNLVVHEFAHVCTYYKLRGGPVPSTWEWITAPMLPGWMYEGLAESEAIRYSQLGYSVLRSAVLEDNLPPLAALDTEADRTLIDLWLKYAAGQSMVAYMTELGGRDAVSEVLDEYQDLPYFHWAVRDVFDMGYDDFFREWQEYVREIYEPLLESHTSVDSHSSPIDLGIDFVRTARISPDGEKIAFVGIKDIQEPFMQLFLADRDGSNRIIVSTDTDIYKSLGFSWSPDSSKLVYGRHWSTSDGYVRFGTYVYNLATGASERISGEQNMLDPAWSPSGDSIAVVVFEEDLGGSHLALIKPDGSDLRVMTDGPGMPRNIYRPTWSPDGTQVCMEVVHRGPDETSVVNLATMGVAPGGPPLRMVLDEENGFSRAPNWSPDGRYLVFHRYAGPAPQVYLYDLQEETIAPLTGENVRSMYDPSFTPEGQVIATGWGSRFADLRLMAPEPLEEPEPMPRPDHEATPPHYTEALSVSDSYPEIDPGQWERRSYSSWNSIRVFLVRPNIIADPYGYQPAVRVFAQDPLEQHTVAAELAYSLQSGQPTGSIEYINSENRGDYFARIRRRLGGPKLVAQNQSVIDAEMAYVVGGRWMRNPIPSTYTRDNYGISLVHQQFDVVDRFGGAVASDQRTTYLEGTWQRFSATPTNVNWSARLTGRASVPQLSRLSQLYEARAELEWNRTWSGTRRQLTLGLDARAATFSSRTGAAIRGSYLLPSIAYRWRLQDYAWSSAWPFIWMDTVDLTLSADYYLQYGNSLLLRPAGPALRAELVGRGHITHGLPYELALGAEYRPQAAAGNRSRFTLTFTTSPESVFGF